MKKISIPVFLGLLAYSTVSHAVTERAVVCENCNYQQAKAIAMEKAWPQLHCQITDGGEVISIDNQSCYSDPKKIVVFNANTRTAFPFEVYHINQGANPHEMVVQARDRNVVAQIVELLNVGVDMQTQLNNSVNELSTGLMGSFNSLMQNAQVLYSANSETFSVATNSSSANCSDDRDAAALDLTYNTRAINQAQQYIQELHRSQTTSVLDSFASYFERNTASLSTVSFNLSKGGTGGPLNVNAEFNITPKTSNFTIVYNSADDLRFFSTKGVSGWVGYPQLVFDIGPNQQGNVTMRINDDYSYVAGYSLAQFRSNDSTASPLEVSPCVLEKLQQNLPQVEFEYTGGGGDYPGSGPGTTPGGGVIGSLCERTIIGRVNGTIVLVLTSLVPC